MTTVAVFSVAGTPIGGPVIGVYPLWIFLASGLALLREGGGEGEGSLFDLVTRTGWLVAFIVGQSYMFAGVPAVMTGTGLATLVAWRRGYGLRQCLAVAVGAVVIWNGLVAALGAGPMAAVIPAVLYPVIVQGVPALIAALVCRWFVACLTGPNTTAVS